MMDAVAWSWIGHRCWERGWRSVGDRKESCRSCGGIWSRVVPDAVAEARIGRKTAILVENSSRISSAMLPRGTFTCGGRGCFAFVQPSLDPKCRFVGRAWFALVAGRIWHCCQIWSDRNTHTERERERERGITEIYIHVYIHLEKSPENRHFDLLRMMACCQTLHFETPLSTTNTNRFIWSLLLFLFKIWVGWLNDSNVF